MPDVSDRKGLRPGPDTCQPTVAGRMLLDKDYGSRRGWTGSGDQISIRDDDATVPGGPCHGDSDHFRVRAVTQAECGQVRSSY